MIKITIAVKNQPQGEIPEGEFVCSNLGRGWRRRIKISPNGPSSIPKINQPATLRFLLEA